MSLKTSDADSDDAVAPVLRCEIENGRGRLGSELTDGIEDPANRNGRARGLVYERIENRIQILLLPQDYARRQSNLGVADTLSGQPLKQATCD